MKNITNNLLTVLTILVLFQYGHHVTHAQSYELIQQYHKCKYLNMTESYDLNRGGVFYIPDSSIPNNTLNASFWISLGLTNRTFNQGFAFIKKIYTDTNNCKSEFCNCATRGFLDYNNKFSIFFRNNTNNAGIIWIISTFNIKYQANRKPLTDDDDQVQRFLAVNDYTWNKFSYFDMPYCYSSYNFTVNFRFLS